MISTVQQNLCDRHKNQDRNFPPFDIRDHIHKLTKAKGKNRYYCELCGGNDFTINPHNGAYKCHHGCATEAVREKIAPWKDRKQSKQKSTRSNHNPYLPLQKKKKFKPALIPEGAIELATLPEGLVKPVRYNIVTNSWIPEKLIANDIGEHLDPKSLEVREYRYWYSGTQWVSRFEWDDPKEPKGHDKTIRQGHRKADGSTKWNKGSAPWLPYRINEVKENGKDKWIIDQEGEPCVEVARCQLSLVSSTLKGDDWSETDIGSKIRLLKEAGVKGLVYIQDNDLPTEKNPIPCGKKKASAIAKAAAELQFPCLIINLADYWQDCPNKGDLVDWVEAHKELSSDQQKSKLIDIIQQQAAQYRAKQAKEKEIEDLEVPGEDNNNDNIPAWNPSDLAHHIIENHKARLAWNTETQQWYRYWAIQEGIWSVEPREFIERLIDSYLQGVQDIYAALGAKKQPEITYGLVTSIHNLLRCRLAVRNWDQAEGLLPLENGVLNLKTGKFEDHCPGNRLTWCLPYQYCSIAQCQPIIDWMLEMAGNDLQQVQLWRAYLHGIVTGRTDWQQYLELIGPGGTGKSTLIRLAIALIGARNTHTTTLKKLENSQFETASIHNKRLVVITDSERWAGGVSVLKALTGQDTLPFEQKFKQSTSGFTPQALVIVAANENIQSSDYTSGLERRRISNPMLKRIEKKNQRNLIEVSNDKLLGEFAPYIPGLLNWVLALPPEEATKIIKNYEVEVPGLLTQKAEALVQSNPIADWLNHKLVYRENYRTNVGTNKQEKEDNWLYPNYYQYCTETGTKPVSTRRFVNLLSDLCLNQIKLEIQRGRDRNGSYFLGLKIRDYQDRDPLLITGNSDPNNPPPPSPPSPPSSPPPLQEKDIAGESKNHTTCSKSVLRKVSKSSVTDSVTDSVTAGILASDGCDGCDGIFEKSAKQREKSSSGGEEQKNSGGELINNQILPSHASHPSPTSSSAVTLSVTETVTDDFVISMKPTENYQPEEGDRVKTEDRGEGIVVAVRPQGFIEVRFLVGEKETETYGYQPNQLTLLGKAEDITVWIEVKVRQPGITPWDAIVDYVDRDRYLVRSYPQRDRKEWVYQNDLTRIK